MSSLLDPNSVSLARLGGFSENDLSQLTLEQVEKLDYNKGFIRMAAINTVFKLHRYHKTAFDNQLFRVSNLISIMILKDFCLGCCFHTSGFVTKCPLYCHSEIDRPDSTFFESGSIESVRQIHFLFGIGCHRSYQRSSVTESK